MRITSKGQVTIPQDVRVRMGFLPNTEVDFVVDGDLVLLVKATEPRRPRPTRGQRVVATLRAHPIKGMTTDEIMALTRGDA